MYVCMYVNIQKYINNGIKASMMNKISFGGKRDKLINMNGFRC